MAGSIFSAVTARQPEDIVPFAYGHLPLGEMRAPQQLVDLRLAQSRHHAAKVIKVREAAFRLPVVVLDGGPDRLGMGLQMPVLGNLA
ncbi:hypothetical protein D3C72_1961530 [compost metagenome]